jgi:hypothetical protein
MLERKKKEHHQKEKALHKEPKKPQLNTYKNLQNKHGKLYQHE